jgi:transcriptional regulator with XRE-family HTH domain
MPRLPVRHDWKEVVIRLRERRTESQVEFARSVGCSVSTVSKWECGATVPGLRQRRALEKVGEDLGWGPAMWPDLSKQGTLFDGEGR